ncbi:acid phosphatase [Alternaria panax]|uniref:Acid phosphatase n=1 Tax=Alternaria panax TaxID=48097 RepID=A0AAD4FER2_9PLEO|nr:acid phosphatase [Alternaria panax]
MDTTWRLRYPDLYDYNATFTMWANYYTSGPRVRDSARLFAQGFVGPNATDLATIYALNASDPASCGNTLAPSDLCKAYNDAGGDPAKDMWDSIYLPPIASRLNAKIQDGLNLTTSQADQIRYLCGFETQITGRRSPFCDVFTNEEILQYEYAQDLRYWYGTGLGSDIEKYQMLLVVDMAAQRFVDGPNATYNTGNGTFAPPKIMANFTNDSQSNQLAAAIGVFDDQPQLHGNTSLPNRVFCSSQAVKMRGTIAFERLSCPAATHNSIYGRDTHNDYNSTASEIFIQIPPTKSYILCWISIIKAKRAKAGDGTKLCNMTGEGFAPDPKATFFFNNTLPWQPVVKPQLPCQVLGHLE